MPKEKTICEVEFDKFWKENMFKVFAFEYKGQVESIWNLAWKTCGDKILESIKEIKNG